MDTPVFPVLPLAPVGFGEPSGNAGFTKRLMKERFWKYPFPPQISRTFPVHA